MLVTVMMSPGAAPMIVTCLPARGITLAWFGDFVNLASLGNQDGRRAVLDALALSIGN
jgi:hypothetical protein